MKSYQMNESSEFWPWYIAQIGNLVHFPHSSAIARICQLPRVSRPVMSAARIISTRNFRCCTVIGRENFTSLSFNTALCRRAPIWLDNKFIVEPCTLDPFSTNGPTPSEPLSSSESPRSCSAISLPLLQPPGCPTPRVRDSMFRSR